MKKNRRRQSLYATSLRDEIAKTQNKYFPRWAKMTVFTMSFIYVLGLFVMVIGQLATISFLNTCDEETFKIKDLIWNKNVEKKYPKLSVTGAFSNSNQNFDLTWDRNIYIKSLCSLIW